MLEDSQRLLGEEHVSTLAAELGVADMPEGQQKHDEAEVIYRRALETEERVFEEDHEYTLYTCYQLAEALRCQAKYGEVEVIYRQNLERWQGFGERASRLARQ
jgi:hypothetical protein